MTPEIPAKKKSKRFIIPTGFYSGKIIEERLDIKEKNNSNIVNKPTEEKIPETVIVEKNPIPKIDNTKRRRSALSIKSLTEKRESTKKKKVAIKYEDLPKNPFKTEELLQLWQENIQNLNKKGEKLLASLLSSVPIKVDGNFILITLPNSRMQQEIDKSKSKVLQVLREALQNYAIDFKYEVNETIEKKFAYTPQEKYEFLKEKNPLVSLLRKTLDLDVQ